MPKIQSAPARVSATSAPVNASTYLGTAEDRSRSARSRYSLAST